MIPAHDGACWERDDWRNWRRRVWGHWGRDGRGQRIWTAGQKKAPRTPAAPPDTRPRDLRSSYITVQIYAGMPLTTIAKQAGTSVAMIDKHYTGVIANWDGRSVPAEVQIAQARELLALAGTGGRSVDVRGQEGV